MYLNLDGFSNDLLLQQGTNSYKIFNSIGNVLKPIVASMIYQTKSLINKTKHIKDNNKLITVYQKQIVNAKSKIFRKKEEIILLQEKIKQKKKRKKEVVDLFESYLYILNSNDSLINTQIDELFHKEIKIYKKEGALGQVLQIKPQKTILKENEAHSNNNFHNNYNFLCDYSKKSQNGREKIKEIITTKKSSTNYFKKNIKTIPRKNNSVDKLEVKKRLSTHKIKKISSLPNIPLNKDQLDIINKTLLNDDEFYKILEDFKLKIDSKSISQRGSIGSLSKRDQIKSFTESNYNLSNGNTIPNSKELKNASTSFHSPIKAPIKVNINDYKNKNLHSSKEKLKKFLLNESLQEKQFNMSMNLEDQINNGSKEDTIISNINKINKSKSDVNFKNKKNHAIVSFSQSRNTVINYDNEHYYMQCKTNKQKYKDFSKLLINVIRKSVYKYNIPRFFGNTFFIYYFTNFLKKNKLYYKTKLKNNVIDILIKSSKVYNESVRNKKIELIFIEDFFDINEFENSKESNQNTKDIFENYNESLNKIKRITQETKELEKNMRQFTCKVCDN